MSSMSAFAQTIMQKRYSHQKSGGGLETWSDIAHRVATTVMGAVGASEELTREVERVIRLRKFMPGGRYLYACGRPFHQTQNCLLLNAEDSREGWANHMHKTTMALMTGAGIGGVYSNLRYEGAPITRTGGVSSGPLALMQMTNEAGRGAMQGGSRRAAIWAGLHWNHPDCAKFIRLKDWSSAVKAIKEKDFSFPATMDFTNISVILDDEFFNAYHDPAHAMHGTAQEIYWDTLKHMLETAEPGFSVDVGANAGEHLRNACTEITSHDDSDICNLGSINMARIESPAEMQEVVELSTAFLIAGTVYSDVPYQKVAEVREKNRRIGLGLLGLHDWFLQRGKRYDTDEELSEYLDKYRASDYYARQWAGKWGLSTPVKTRAVAPTGTIGIVAETTTGIEPIFCAAMKRRYYDRGALRYQYVLDPTAARLVREGADPELIEDAYSLANDVERRVRFQAWLQSYVDHAISSTINLPSWGSIGNNPDTVQSFGDMLIKYLPKLRGVTAYPDGARGGQPLVPVPWKEAAEHVGEVFTEGQDVCDITRGGSCGA